MRAPREFLLAIMLFVLSLTCFTNITSPHLSFIQTEPQKQFFDISEIPQIPQSQTYDIHVYLLNIDDRITSNRIEDLLDAYSYGDTFTEHGSRSLEYVANYTFERLSTSYLDEFIEYVNTTGIGINTTHPNSDFNLTAFNQGETKAFSNMTGLAIDVNKSADWIETNWYEKEHEITGYVMYLMNLTTLDVTYGKHWFSHIPYDYGTNDTTRYFFSGRNGLDTRPTPGWGGQERFYFLDVSSYQWYGKWLDNAWDGGLYISAGSGDYLLNRIQDVTSGLNLDDSYDQSTVATYLVRWINDITYNIFLGSAIPNDPIRYQQYTFQTLMLSNLTDYGYNVSDLEWLLDNDQLYKPFEDLTPYLDYEFETTLVELSEYPHLEGIFDYFVERYNNSVDISNIENDWNTGLANLLIDYITTTSDFFDLDKPGIVFPTLGIITNDTTFLIGQIPIAGVSYGDWQFLSVTPQRFMRENETGDLVVPDRSLNQLLIHEVGHTVGLPHPHEDYGFRWGGDFIDSAVTYYTYSYNFNFADKDRLGRYHANSWNMHYVEKYQEWLDFKNSFTSDPRQELIDLENEAILHWTAGNSSLKLMNFTKSIIEFRKATYALQSALVYIGEIIPPSVISVTHEPNNGMDRIYEDSTVFIQVQASDDSGIQKIILSYRINGESWTTMSMASVKYYNPGPNTIGYYVYAVEIGPFPVGSFVEYYVNVYDKSSNNNFKISPEDGSYYSFTIESHISQTTPNFDVPFVFDLAVIVVLGLLTSFKRKLCKKRRK
ncbi:MAG: hypothetical protein ACXAEU_20565 [Candidatus Hodarchaeales archaeon]|jgi:hypothetical protein